MPAEFQAIIIALHSAEELGTAAGFNFSEVPEPDSSGTVPRPKFLLPICNRPILLHQLDWLAQEGFDEVTVVVQQSNKPLVDKLVFGDNSKPKIKINIYGIGNIQAESADALRQLNKDKKLLNVDLLILDAGVVTNFKLCETANLLRQTDAFGVVLLDSDRPMTDSVPCSNQRRALPKEVSLIAPNGQLLSVMNQNDFQARYVVPSRILSSFADIMIHSRFFDAHVYLFRHSVLDFLEQHGTIRSLKHELIPAILKRSVGHAGRSTDAKSLKYRNYKVMCAFAHETTSSSEYFLSIRDRASWMEANRQLLRAGLAHKKLSSSPSTAGAATDREHKPQVTGTEYAIGADCTFGESCALRKCVIGAQCQVGRNVSLTNCVLLDGVRIGDGVKLTGCVVGDGAILQDSVELRDCVVAVHAQVQARTRVNNELIEAELEDTQMSDEDEDQKHGEDSEGNSDSTADSEVD